MTRLALERAHAVLRAYRAWYVARTIHSIAIAYDNGVCRGDTHECMLDRVATEAVMAAIDRALVDDVDAAQLDEALDHEGLTVEARLAMWEIYDRWTAGKALDVRRCRDCGCTDAWACPGGCWWVERDLCSSCRTAIAGARR